MNGRLLAGGLVAFAVLFGAVLWYAQTRAYYETVTRDSIDIAGQTVPVKGYEGIDAASSPLKRRGCFRMAQAPDAPATDDAVPLTAPDWFPCFDARAIAEDLAAGRATAYLAAREEFDGIDRLVAVYPDGRAFEWRQLSEKYRD